MANFIEEPRDKFFFVYSSEVNIPFRIKIGTVEGNREKKSVQSLIDDPELLFSGLYQSEFSDLYVVSQIFCNDRPITLPTQTSYKSFSSRWNWNEWISLPIHYKDIPRSAVLALTVYDIYGPRKNVIVGGTVIPIFSKHGCLRRGIHDLRVWPGEEGDGSLKDSTPGELENEAGQSEMMRLAALVKKHRKGRMMAVDWLDRLTYREIEVINEREKRDSRCLFLTIEFPKFHFNGIEHSIVYFEPDGEVTDQYPPDSEFRIVLDPECNMENLVEAKHHRLTHSLRKGLIARELKPNTRTRDHLLNILSYSPTHQLTANEKSLVWQFRYYLTQEKKALTKFLQSVDWSSKQEADEAIELMYKWQPLDPSDALELLTPSPSFREAKVRKYAISRLQCTDNEELMLYLLQLVQALRYEEPEFLSASKLVELSGLSIEDTYTMVTKTRVEQEIAAAVQDEGDEPEDLGPDGEEKREEDEGSDSDSDSGEIVGGPHQQGVAQSVMEASLWSLDASAPSSLEQSVYETEFPDLASFLIARGCRSTKLASYFYWYLTVECSEDKDSMSRIKYERIRLKFLDDLKNSGKIRWQKRFKMLTQQELLVGQLTHMLTTIGNSKDDRPKRIEKLKAVLSSSPRLLCFDHPIRLPLDPDFKVMGISARDASLFKSNLMPARLGFRTNDDQTYWVMFKVGDDLRQDQLILQLINLMDRLLRRENLDLKLTAYNVLACSGNHGILQLVDQTHTVARVLSSYKSIQNFFRKCTPHDNAPYGIHPETMDTYVKSCAGYCVITYLLGVGDRHLDNLLLSEQGHLIHVDFGYILGRDPKPLPPPMKLNKEMVEAMGGTGSPEYQKFREHCYSAFLTLRRSSNLILNLFSLMVDSGVPDIALEPDKTVHKVREKFRLDLNEEEAVQHLQSLIDDSVRAIMAVVVEQIHKWAQNFRK